MITKRMEMIFGEKRLILSMLHNVRIWRTFVTNCRTFCGIFGNIPLNLVWNDLIVFVQRTGLVKRERQKKQKPPREWGGGNGG